ncbi:MAG TPA: hypothetical protein VHT51_14740 [Micropepsaceae bacterium]|nr:hypothetical protein [Micropepsaceae bacterium]
MIIPIAVLTISLFALLIAVRASSLVGKRGTVHRKTAPVRQALAYRKRLDRKVHAHR